MTQTAPETEALIKSLRAACVDWDGSQMPDGAEPMPVTCVALRSAANALQALSAKVAELEGLVDAVRQEGYDEGYDEGNLISKSAEGELWRGLTRWGVANGQIIEDMPDGYSADDMMQAVLDREARLIRRAETAEAQVTTLTEAVEAINVTDEELLRIRNACEHEDGQIKIWAKMLQKLIDHIRHLRAAIRTRTHTERKGP